MAEESASVEVAYTSEFKRNLRRLAKKYRSIRADVEPVIQQLEQGQTPGDQISQTGYTVFKVRIRNSNARRGKSGGYRMLYYVVTPVRVVLVTIYSKSDQGDIAPKAIRATIGAYERG